MSIEKETCPECNEAAYLIGAVKCWKCREKDKLNELKEEAVKEGETSYEEYVVCPYCGENYGEEEMNETCDVVCGECDKKFHVEVEYDVHYSTSKR